MTAGKWHMDERVSMAVQQLLDELSSWERATGRHTTLFLIPLASDEKFVIAHDGVSVEDTSMQQTPEQHFANAMAARRPK